MIWARRLMFSTTDLIFPGFSDATIGKVDPNRKAFRAVRVRSSWSLQAILYADALFFTFWVLSFLCTFDISMSVLKELHGNLIVCMTALFIIVNVPRLMFGFRGNGRDKLELLALFWMTTFIVQAPLLGFILFTDIFTPVLRAFTTAMDSCMMILIILEFLFGTYHLKNLVNDELRIIKLAKLTERSPPSQPRHEENAEPLELPVPLRNPGDLEVPPRNNEYYDDDDDSDDWSSDGETDDYRRKFLETKEDTKVDYRVNIRRLTPEREPAEPADESVFTADEEEEDNDDDSNVVTSTSDAVRQRSTRVS
ncbi:uncharacterized protein LOC110844469 [Folsomia candida]|nr:uncharacterized protein LOC110844469 [Folsomia candida]